MDWIDRSADEHFIFHIDPVDGLGRRGKKELEPAFDAGHYSGDLAGRDDDLLLDKIRCIDHLRVSTFDRSADHLDLVFCRDSRFADELL